MLNWHRRTREWKKVVGLAPFGRAVRAMVIAILSGPVPTDTWLDRMRTCYHCPVFDRELYACRKVLDDGRELGCGCFTPYQSLTAAPYPLGCWAAQVTGNQEGWPAYRFASRRDKFLAVWRFLTAQP